ncbi:MAG: peptidoglycan DD-metalloendopeptidase family protein [Selenomonadaceae bacterium]|nr:peptidoglycan DD-metalloendopeptidase family protein [Selenomonadaceae bacterium]
MKKVSLFPLLTALIVALCLTVVSEWHSMEIASAAVNQRTTTTSNGGMVRPAGSRTVTTNTQQCVGKLENYGTLPNMLRVMGYAYDKRNMSSKLRVLVCLDGTNPNNAKKRYVITANKSHRSYNGHGFDDTVNVPTELCGKRTVNIYVVAINGSTQKVGSMVIDIPKPSTPKQSTSDQNNTNSGSGKKGDLNGNGEIDLNDLARVQKLIINGEYNAIADMDGDGKITDNDAKIMQRISLGMDVPDTSNIKGDVNGDGKVDFMNDAIMLLNYINGKISSLPAKQNADMNNDGQLDINDVVAIKLKSGLTAEPNPKGSVESVSSPGDYQLYVKGYAYDEGNMNQPLEVHVYVGGVPVSNVPQWSIAANKAYSPMGNHGFEDTHSNISNQYVGRQLVHVYALNASGTAGNNVEIWNGYVDIKGTKPVYNPEGRVESVVSNAPGQITVRGWALDRDDMNRAIDVHIYVGNTRSDNGGEKHTATANKANSSYPNHGFEATFATNKTGNQPVYVYGINIGGGSDANMAASPTNVNILSANLSPSGYAYPLGSRSKFGNGHDCAKPEGTAVYAVESGTAYFYQVMGDYANRGYATVSYGNYIQLKCDNGAEARYGHLSRFEGVELKYKSMQNYGSTYSKCTNYGKKLIGSRHVNKGDVIGYVGTTGNSSGNHLHFEFYINGSRRNVNSYFDK